MTSSGAAALLPNDHADLRAVGGGARLGTHEPSECGSQMEEIRNLATGGPSVGCAGTERRLLAIILAEGGSRR